MRILKLTCLIIFGLLLFGLGLSLLGTPIVVIAGGLIATFGVFIFVVGFANI